MATLNIPIDPVTPKSIEPIVDVQPQPLQDLNNNQPQLQTNTISSNESNVIIDYRSKYFEEEEKNKELQAQIDELTQKLNEIKKVIE